MHIITCHISHRLPSAYAASGVACCAENPMVIDENGLRPRRPTPFRARTQRPGRIAPYRRCAGLRRARPPRTISAPRAAAAAALRHSRQARCLLRALDAAKKTLCAVGSGRHNKQQPTVRPSGQPRLRRLAARSRRVPHGLVRSPHSASRAVGPCTHSIHGGERASALLWSAGISRSNSTAPSAKMLSAPSQAALQCSSVRKGAMPPPSWCHS